MLSHFNCVQLCNLMDCNPPGSSVRGILQPRILEWVVMPSSRGSSQPRDRNCVSCLLHWQEGPLPLPPPGKPYTISVYFEYLFAKKLKLIANNQHLYIRFKFLSNLMQIKLALCHEFHHFFKFVLCTFFNF